jgi:hypothetical protein
MQDSAGLIIDVEKARARLKELAKAQQGTFWLACEAAHKNRTPRDPDGLLRQPGQTAFTDESGEWLPGRRELITQLTQPDPNDELNYVVLDPMPVAEAA